MSVGNVSQPRADRRDGTPAPVAESPAMESHERGLPEPLPGAVTTPRVAPAGKADWTWPIVAAALITAVFCWLFWDFIAKQVRFAIYQQADWGHTLVIPFIAGYFVWLNRQRLIDAGLRTTWLGLVPVILGIAAYLACTMGPVTLRHHNLQGAGVALTITGLALLFVGWRAMRWLLFPLVYLFIFGQTISESLLNRVTFYMQDITARGAGAALSLFLDVDRMGNTLYIWRAGASIPLNIAEACSGMRMLMAFLALSVAMAYTGLRHPWQRVLLVLMAVPTAIVVNILRVCTLGVLSLVDSGLAAGDFHSFIGLVWLMPAFLIFLGLMWIIRNSVIEQESRPSASSAPSGAGLSHERATAAPSGGGAFDRRAVSALVVSCTALLVCGIGFRFAVAGLNIYLRKESVPLRAGFTLATIPRTLGQWRALGEDAVFDKSMIEALGTDVYLDRWYAFDGDSTARRGPSPGGHLHVHIAYYTGLIDAVPHIPDRCFVAAGLEPRSLSQVLPLAVDRSTWLLDGGPANLATGEPYQVVNHQDWLTGLVHQVRMPVGDLAIRVTEFGSKDQPNVNIFGGFLFIANGRATATPEDIRMLAFRPSERFAYYCKLQFVYAAPAATQEQYLDMVSDFLRDALPEIMLRLPDWQAIEKR